MKSKLTKDQWVDGLDGIGQILSLHNFYVEEYSPEIIEGKSVGDFLRTIAVYKVLCHFNGKVRKRNIILSCNANLCRPISKNSQDFVKAIQDNQPNDYEKYIAYQKKKPIDHTVDIWLKVPVEIRMQIQEGISSINKELNKPFIYPEFEEKLKDHRIKINLDLMHNDEYPPKNNFIISFFNDNFLVKNKRALFTMVKGIALQKNNGTK